MTIPISARPVYTRREVPKDPAQLSGWLQTELSNVQRAFIPTRSRTVMANDTVKATDTVVYADATHAAFTETLPPANQVKDLVVTIKKVDASGNAVTIGGTVDGVLNRMLAAQFDAVTIASDGTQYLLLASV